MVERGGVHCPGVLLVQQSKQQGHQPVSIVSSKMKQEHLEGWEGVLLRLPTAGCSRGLLPPWQPSCARCQLRHNLSACC
jgi:hypothetical protein